MSIVTSGKAEGVDAKPENIEKLTKVLVRFKNSLEPIHADLGNIEGHLQSLDQELSGEYTEVQKITNAMVDLSEKYDGRDLEKALAALAGEEAEAAERASQKLNQNFDQEVEELESFVEDIKEMQEAAKQAQIALEKLEKLHEKLNAKPA